MKLKFILFAVVGFMVLPVVSQTPEEEFYQLLSDKKYSAADSVLTSWTATNPKDAELIPARFNYYLNKSRDEIVVLYEDSIVPGGYVLNDSIDNPVGSISSEINWDDNLYNKAIEEIEAGIKAYPERLDFRFGLAKALEMRELYDKEELVLSDVLSRCSEPGALWRWTDNEIVTDKNMIPDTILDYCSVMFNANADEQLQSLCKKYLEVFPDDFKIMNLLGGSYTSTGHVKEALSTFEKAMNISPNDPILMLNIAYVYVQTGDIEKAKKIYQQVSDNPHSNVKQREYATEAFIELTTEKPKVNITHYQLFHQWLSVACNNLTKEQAENLASPYYFNTFLLAQRSLKSPFEDKDITVETIKDGNHTVYVWKFPEPKKNREALYMAFFEVDNHIKAYAICKGDLVDWEISTSNETSRQTYGSVERPKTAKQCVEILKARGAYSGKISPGEFFPKSK